MEHPVASIVATIGSAKFTATNFTEVRSGVPGAGDPLKNPTPAFNTVTRTRSMTAAEKTQWCGSSTASSRALKAVAARPASRLVPGRSVARVALGETQATVLRRLGWPAQKRFELEPCRGFEGCLAERGAGGTWLYKDRKLAVVFGPDRRVVALIHHGDRRTREGLGRGSTMASLRGSFRDLACRRAGRRVDCSVKRVSGGRTVRTVFRLTHPGDGRWTTTQVSIHIDGRGGKA